MESFGPHCILLVSFLSTAIAANSAAEPMLLSDTVATVTCSTATQSGMFWFLRGVKAIIASRCCQFSRRFEDFWKTTAA